MTTSTATRCACSPTTILRRNLEADGTGGPRDLDKLFTRELLESEFSDFEILQLEEHDGEIHERPGHAGMSALIDLVARKPDMAASFG
jgi:hypothetical protein